MRLENTDTGTLVTTYSAKGTKTNAPGTLTVFHANSNGNSLKVFEYGDVSQLVNDPFHFEMNQLNYSELSLKDQTTKTSSSMWPKSAGHLMADFEFSDQLAITRRAVGKR